MKIVEQTENHLHSFESRWFAIYTRFKYEKVVHKELTSRGIESYLPLQKKMKIYGRKKRWVELPLFSCYVFVKITKTEYVPVLSTEGVVKFIKFSKNLLSIPELEIQTVRRIIDNEIPIEIEQNSFRQGEKVQIIKGNLIGMEGVLLEIQGKKNVLIELMHLGYTLKLEIPSSFLGRLNTLKTMK